MTIIKASIYLKQIINRTIVAIVKTPARISVPLLLFNAMLIKPKVIAHRTKIPQYLKNVAIPIANINL